MHIKRFWLGLAALVLCFHGHTVDAQAANNGSNPGISQKVAPCDWSYPTRCLKVNADGSINTSGGGGGGGAVTGALASFADGWSVTTGLQADTACATDNGACTTQALLKRQNQRITSLITALGSPLQAATALPAGTAVLGATYSFQGSAGNALPPAADASAFLNMSTATTTQIVALSAAKKIYVSSFDLVAAGTTNAKFVYGTGANCGTGTTDITANWNLAAQAGVARGAGIGVLFAVPASNALCVTNSAAQVLAVNVSYAQY